jgi:glycine/D-amino acid oxidase-like deaminating enzyme
MDLRSHYPYWLLKNGIMNNYPSLQENSQCDVAIVGAGISGALAAWYLGKAGISTILLDKRHAGTGSTAASTALLQYEIDVPLVDLIEKVGEKNAIESYRLCLEAIGKIEQICDKVESKCDFTWKPSLQYASFNKHIDSLEKEFNCRKENGFPVHWLNQQQIEKQYGFSKPDAILSDVGAELDAYKLTNNILQYCIKHYGTKVFDKTAVASISKSKNRFVLATDYGVSINAKHVVIACGYESEQWLNQKVEILHSTFAIISEPFPQQHFWHKNSLIWETAKPYLYMRTTKDNRILIGGKDTPYTSAVARDRQLKRKIIALENSFQSLFPGIDFRTDFSWAGTFAGTKDGLPYIDEHPTRKGIYFSLGFGGNGITFSAIAGEIIRDMIVGKKNKHASIFKFNR